MLSLWSNYKELEFGSKHSNVGFYYNMWKKLDINDCHYFIKQDITAERVITIFSDLINIWEEAIPRDSAIQRFKQNNPKISAPDEKVLEFITSLAKENDFNLSLDEIGVNRSLQMSSRLIPKMVYEFSLSIKSADTVYREITLPLIMFISELKHRQEVLCQQLKDKDVEIMEYNLDGFKISRKNVITSKFEEEEFKNGTQKFMEERLKTNLQNAANVFINDINEFYPYYEKVTLPIPTNLLKQGKISEDRIEEPPKKVSEKVETPPKRKYAVQPSIPIKRSKTTKKRIL